MYDPYPNLLTNKESEIQTAIRIQWGMLERT
jgi:hypothetical protein